MGGKKKKGNFFGQVADATVGAVKSGVRTVTGGIYDPSTGAINIGNEAQLKNFESGITGAEVQQAFTGKPEDAAKDLPPMVDPEVQKKLAEEEVQRKILDQYSGNKAGLASTLLGGSLSTDTGVLKKKKLLGE